ncbi:FAD-dependent oxidoreductase [Thermodesulfobacteriota bacterium]
MNYPHLFQPGRLGSLTLKNRLVMSPMTMNYAAENGLATDKLIRHYVERARGGVGLIIVEGTYFVQEGKGYVNQLGLVTDEHAEKLKSLTDQVHALGNQARIFIQIHHAGWRVSSKITGMTPVGPSALAPYPGAETARSLSIEEIASVVTAHVDAASRAKDAGFDGVDIHCAHGYLIPSFLSPVSNQRTDGYGGDVAGRTRILTEIISGIKTRLGADFPVTIKISGDEYIKGGLSLEDTVEILQIAELAGLDGVMVSAGTVGIEKPKTLTDAHRALRTLPMMTAHGCLVPLAGEVKKRLKIPVAAVGRINTPGLAEEVIRDGLADFVAMGRALLADPYFAEKTVAGKEDLIRPCIGCNEGCYKQIFRQAEIQCSTNPTIGRDHEIECSKTEKPRKVLVIGGGPGGLEAAYAAWERGHRVVIWEKNENLGGQLNLAALPPGRKEIERFKNFQKNRLRSTDIEVVCNRTASAENIRSIDADLIICASGASPQELKIEGSENVAMVSAWDIIGTDEEYREPFIVIGGGLAGCEAADCLSSKGLQVSLVEMLPEIASDGDGDTKTYFQLRLDGNHVTVYTGATIQAIDDGAATISLDGETVSVPVATLVIAAGSIANDSIFETLQHEQMNVVRVGDCISPRRIIEAVREGFEAGRNA